MQTINRFAVVLCPLQPFVDWANSAPVRGTAPRGAFGGSQGTAPTAPASAAASGAAAAGTARQTGATMTT